MFDLNSWLAGLAALLAAAAVTWVYSALRRNVTIVDSLWSLLFVIAAFVYVQGAPEGPRARLVLLLVSLWGLRLCIYLTLRNAGQPEDRRYAAIRRRNDPGFTAKSLYLVFGFQAVLAWLISLPLLGAIRGGTGALGWLDFAGIALWGVGLFFEAVGDWQLARFKADPANADAVMDRGLWRYTRHPNYFGDFCVWWGFYLIALAAGAWWSAVGPVLMSLLLLRYSGVALLERTIGKRRPKYEDYVRRTNAFVPGPPRG